MSKNTSHITQRKIARYGWSPDLPDQRDHLFAAPLLKLGPLPAKVDLRWHRIIGVLSDHLSWKRADDAWTYNVVQRLTYLGVVFALFPAIIWTGLAMSFAVTSVFPILATALGGHQSARTLHFVFVSLLVLFLIVHLVMLWLVGFWGHVRAMITGHIPQGRSAR